MKWVVHRQPKWAVAWAIDVEPAWLKTSRTVDVVCLKPFTVAVSLEERFRAPLPTPTLRSIETRMGCSLPPEILDLIIDNLHDEPTTLKTCSVVSKSWIQRARKHLFVDIEFHPPDRPVT